jgi:hypothetical protein
MGEKTGKIEREESALKYLEQREAANKSAEFRQNF